MSFFLYFFAASLLLGLGLSISNPDQLGLAYAYYGLSLAGASTAALFAKLNRTGDTLVGLIAILVALGLFATAQPFLFLNATNAQWVYVPGLLLMLGLDAFGPRSKTMKAQSGPSQNTQLFRPPSPGSNPAGPSTPSPGAPGPAGGPLGS